MDKAHLTRIGLLLLIIFGIIFGFYPMLYLTIFLWVGYTVLKYNGLLPKKSLKGEHAFITGGAMGIGKELASQLLQLGCKITIIDVNNEALENSKKEFKKMGFSNVEAFKCDVTDRENVEKTIKKSVEKLGDIDILVNNAGIGSGGLFHEKDVDSMLKVCNVNLVSHFYTVKTVINKMIEKNHGHIVTVASVASYLRGVGILDYHVSKKGVLGFHEGLVQELKFLKSNVEATVICPWFIKTNLTQDMSRTDMVDLKSSVTRIVTAIQQNEDVVIIPFAVNILIFLHQMLPFDIFYAIFEMIDKADDSLLKKKEKQL